MRLLKYDGNETFSLTKFNDDHIPHYAILSHTWGADGEEVTYNDLREGTGKNKTGYKKIEFCRKQAAGDGLQYFWVDTCCIDKSSSAELTGAINSMFRWYRNADKCYVYLSDVSTSPPAIHDQPLPTSTEAAFRRSRWFCRGWTLQELVAPASVEFFSGEGNALGTRISLEAIIHEVTGVAIEALRGRPLAHFSVAERLSWAEHRETKLQEDKAYSLLGLFGIYMPLFYGEGSDKAIQRLQGKIGKPLNPPVAKMKESPLPSSTIPFRRNVDFVDRRAQQGRGTVLEQIEQLCVAQTARISLLGIGGAGKSQLAIEFCYRLQERSPENWVFWIHASNADRIDQGFRAIAEQVEILKHGDLSENLLDLVARWLRDQTSGRWVLVLDDLDDEALISAPQATLSRQPIDRDGKPQQTLSSYLPQTRNGTVLITTRSKSVATALVEQRNTILVDPMFDTEATELLQKKLHGIGEKRDLKELASTLGHMPIAIVQAAAYIQQQEARCSVRQYIEAFQTNEKENTSLHEFNALQPRLHLDAEDSVYTTWQISFDDIRKRWPVSADLLSLMSYFDPQSIPDEVLKHQLRDEKIWKTTKQDTDLVRENEKEQQQDIEEDAAFNRYYDNIFREAMARLQSYSLVTVGLNERTFEMHRLVQLAIRIWLEMHGEEEKWRALFCQKLNAVLPTSDYENWALWERLFPHAKFAERERPTDLRTVREWAQILRKAAWYAWARGSYAEAARMCEQSVQVLKEVAAEEQIEISYSLGLLAKVYRGQARLLEAEKVDVEVMVTRKRWLGHEHPDTLTSIANLASTYRDQGRWIEAKEMELEVMEKREKVLGEEHPDTLNSKANLASTYQNQGRWDAAEELFVQVMNVGWRVLGREHPLTLTSMASLASIYRNQGRWKDAEELEGQILEAFRKMAGPEHPSTISSMANLASTYRDQGRWEDAKELQVQVMRTSLKVLGPDHPDTLNSMANLASTLWSQGRWSEAETIEAEVMETSQRVLGKEHPDTLTSIANLASTYQNQGRWIEAEEMLVRVVKARTRVLGYDHPVTLVSIANLASTYRKQGQWHAAEELEVQVMEISKTKLGLDHPNTLSSMANLASTYRHQGRWDAAEELFMQVIEIRKTKLGADHPDTLTSMANLASTFWNQERWDAAEELFTQVIEIRKRKLGPDHPDTLTSMANLASTYRNQGRWNTAEKLEVHVMEMRKSKLGPDHPDTLMAMHNLAFTLQSQGREAEARDLMRECQYRRERVLGECHPDSKSSFEALLQWTTEPGETDGPEGSAATSES